MKYLLPCFLLLLRLSTYAQTDGAPNIFIITTDGFRWQEIFSGADEKIMSAEADSGLLRQLYWSEDINERRRMLMPFTWNILAKYGSLYGNRNYNNKVNVANPYRFSYAGYNEIFCGYADNAVIANKKKWNRNSNILDLLNNTTSYKNKVAAFTSWNLFPYIFNKRNSDIHLNSGYQAIRADSLTESELLLNGIQQHIADTSQHCRNDMLTFVTAREYIQKQHPKIVYISFGETDEWAHHGNYTGYLNSAHLFDEYLAQLWQLVNKDPFYKNNTSFIITTDHGRGQKASSWNRHGPFVAGSNETWLMVLGQYMPAEGECKKESLIYNEQLAQTIGRSSGYDILTEVAAEPVYSLLKDKP